MTGPDQRGGSARVERELPNLRAVERRLAPGTAADDVDTGLRLAAGLQLSGTSGREGARAWRGCAARWSSRAAVRRCAARPARPLA